MLPRTNKREASQSCDIRTAFLSHSKLPVVPFFAASRVNERHPLKETVCGVIERQNFVLGAEVAAFEASFADYCGVAHAVGVGNGTDALELSLRAIDIGPGKKVITVANAGFYTSAATYATGASPIYVDVRRADLTMCPHALERVLEAEKCHAIVATHLFGQLVDIDAIKQIASKHKVLLVEDCAQAHGAVVNGRKAGSFGDVSAFSFYPTKNLGALGDGGAVVTNEARLAKKIRSLRQYGWGSKYEVILSGGGNSRLDEMQAAVLRVKLPYLDQDNHARIEIAKKYNDAFRPLRVQCPTISERENVCHLYVLRTSDRTRLLRTLTDRNIQHAIHYPVLDYKQPALGVVKAQHACNNSEEAVSTIISLPCYPNMPESDVDRVIEAVCWSEQNGSCGV